MLLLPLLLLAPLAQNSTDLTRVDRATVTIDGQDFPYLLLGPAEAEANKKYPLVLFLHGAGERGNDNRAQWRHFPERMAARMEAGATPFYVLAPQCPHGSWWSLREEVGAELAQASPATAMQAAIAALREVVRSRPIDRDRVALTGLSMGGFGSWELAARHPDWFSAVIPICGGGDPRWAPRLAGLAMQVWHGAADRVVPPRRSRTMVEALRGVGNTPDYHELPGVGHNSWSAAYADPTCLKMLTGSRRNPAARVHAQSALLAKEIADDEVIAFLGDSITQAGNRPGGYVDLIRSALAEPRPGVRVVPAGISGNKVPDLLRRFRHDVIDTGATLVFVYIGINDVWHSVRDNGTPEGAYEHGLRTLVRTLRASGASVILATPTVIGEAAPGSNPLDAMLDRYAALSRRVAVEEGATLCDLHQVFQDHLRLYGPAEGDRGVLTRDSVHLNPAGDALVAAEAAAALARAVMARK